MQLLAPLEGWCDPAPQGKHSVEPFTGAYRPGAQACCVPQTVARRELTAYPTAHRSQMLAPGNVLYDPG